jgi:DNA-directed RNA polymerase subunit RPC12/RpoP
MKNNQKPIDRDVHFKYLCRKCGQEHWLSLKEASTEDYKIVCFCDHVFGVRPIADIRIKYKDRIVTQSQETPPTTKIAVTPPSNNAIPIPFYNDAIGLLVGYGFTQAEAKDMVRSAYEKSPTDDYKILVKTILGSLEISYGN